MSPSRTKKTRSSRARTTRGGPSWTTWPATRYGIGGATGAGGGAAASTCALCFGAARTGAFDPKSSPRGPERPSREGRDRAPSPLRGSFLGAAATGCGSLTRGAGLSAKNHTPAAAAAAASVHANTLFFRPTDQKLKRGIAPAQSHPEFSLV